jgi:hypothetical protein
VLVSACTTATRRAPGYSRCASSSVAVECPAPLFLDAHDLGAAAARDLAHAVAEHAVGTDDRGVARLEQVDEARLHAGRAGAADRQRELVLGTEHGAQARHRVVEDGEEFGIHVADQRPGERGNGLGVRVRRPGAEQESVGERHGRTLPSQLPSSLASGASGRSVRRGDDREPVLEQTATSRPRRRRRPDARDLRCRTRRDGIGSHFAPRHTLDGLVASHAAVAAWRDLCARRSGRCDVARADFVDRSVGFERC